MTNYIIGAVVIAFIGMAGYCEVQKKQCEVQKKQAIEKTQIEERNSCENMINESNFKSTKTTIKTIKRYETIKSNLSTTTLDQRTRLLQQIENFNFTD
jgi:hypothetical protein